jgi:hypothetical protein
MVRAKKQTQVSQRNRREERSRNRKKEKRAFTQLGAICDRQLLNSAVVEVDSPWLCGGRHTGKARGGEKAMKGGKFNYW